MDSAIIADNKLHERGGWDAKLLGVELADLQTMGADLSLTRMTAADLRKHVPAAAVEAEPEASEDDDAADDALYRTQLTK